MGEGDGDELGGFERVDEPGHVAGGAAERLAELALGGGAASLQPPDHLGAGASQALLGEPALHPVREQNAQLEQALEDLIAVD